MSSAENITPLKIASAERSVRHVFVRDLMLEALIGVYKHEKRRHQPIRVNIDLTVTEDLHGDRLDNVVCYEDVVKRVKAIVDDGHIHLVETLAERIATVCLGDTRVKVARVRVEKLEAISEAASVGVEIERIAG